MGDRRTDDVVTELRQTMDGHVDDGTIPGLAWQVTHAGETHSGVAGLLELEGDRPVEIDSIFRISSTTKPIIAACAMSLVDDHIIGLDAPVTDLLPELADRQVLAVATRQVTETVPADREITLRDLLTFRLGLGYDFTGAPQPAMELAAERGVPMGPPRPADHPAADEYLRILGSVPLEHQPGERWLYHLGADVLGVLIGRACGTTLGEALQNRILDPLGMVDTGFSVPAADLDRFGATYWDPDGDGRNEFDPVRGQWRAPPPFEGGGAGLVSTVADLSRFGSMLLHGGRSGDQQVLSAESVAAMTTDQLTDEQHASGPGGPQAGLGWGLGMAVQISDVPGRSVGGFGWDGGLGTTFSVDPARHLVVVLMTNQMWSSPEPPSIHQEILRAAARLAD